MITQNIFTALTLCSETLPDRKQKPGVWLLRCLTFLGDTSMVVFVAGLEASYKKNLVLTDKAMKLVSQ